MLLGQAGGFQQVVLQRRRQRPGVVNGDRKAHDAVCASVDVVAAVSFMPSPRPRPCGYSFFPSIPRKMSIGIGNSVVELFSVAISARVCR